MAIDSTPPLAVTFITPEHLKTRLDAGEYLCLIDARESAEFGTAHIPGAQWCARDLLAAQIERAAPTPSMYHWWCIVAVVRPLRCLYPPCSDSATRTFSSSRVVFSPGVQQVSQLRQAA